MTTSDDDPASKFKGWLDQFNLFLDIQTTSLVKKKTYRCTLYN